MWRFHSSCSKEAKLRESGEHKQKIIAMLDTLFMFSMPISHSSSLLALGVATLTRP